MISSRSRQRDWILGIREKVQIPVDPILIEKTILSLSLLEHLRETGLDFTFKGGTSLLLVLARPGRLSIDLDIVVDTESGLQAALRSIPGRGVFTRFEEDRRASPIPKLHYKFFFPSQVTGREHSILLDVLIDRDPYPLVQEVKLISEFIANEGEPVSIRCPALECLLGDKLTAFAPRTTGVLYGRDKDLEIIKQLYDIGLLFDEISDLVLLEKTFYSYAAKEMAYRKLTSLTVLDVLSDGFDTALLIGTRGYGHKTEFAELQSGIKKLSGYVYAESFTLESAILCAAKSAYLAAMIRREFSQIERYDSRLDLRETLILDAAYSKLNRVRKTSLQAFYYFYRAVAG